LHEANISEEAIMGEIDEKANQRLLSEFDNNIETGFQLATYRGPLCAEPVIGMAYIVENIEIAKGDDGDDSREWSGSRR
jgi:translation elongation factor EF-G